MIFHWTKMLPIFILLENVKGWNSSDAFGAPNIIKLQALDMWRLEIEWIVNQNEMELRNETYEIQVGRSENMDLVDSMNVSGRSGSVIWSSQLPLNCTNHSVRMRLISDTSRIGAWSSWITNSGESADGDILLFPKDQVLLEGSTVMFCSIFPTDKNISFMFFNHAQYEVINVSPRVKAIQVKNIPATSSYGVFFTWDLDYDTVLNYVSFPPEKPQDLRCETEDMRSISCSWHTRRAPNLSDNYKRKNTLLISGSGPVSCPDTSCSFKVVPRQINYNITLLVTNSLGRESESYIFNITDRVPFRLEANPGVFDSSVALHLNGSFKGLQLICQLELKPGGTTRELDKQGSDSGERYSFRLQHLKPSTQYFTRGRCAVQGNDWGRWTPTKDFTTEPLVTVNLWRRIREHPNHTVSLLWKPVSSNAESYIEAYEVCVNDTDPKTNVCKNVTETHVDLTIDVHSCNISVRAVTQTGLSIPTNITIPAANTDTALSMLKRITGNDKGFQLSWTRDSETTCDYVVEWCMLGIVPPCSLEWRSVSANQTSLNLSAGHFKAGVLYMFTVYRCSAKVHHLHEKQIGYFKEQVPTKYPSLDSNPEITVSSVKLKWTFNEQDQSHTGFITGYVITVQGHSETGSDFRFYNQSVEDPQRKSLTISGLKEDQLYTFHLAACTSVGCGVQTSATYRTTKNYFLLTAKILVPLLVLVTCCVCLWSLRSKLRGFPEEMFDILHIKALDLDEDLHEASEKIHNLGIEDCKWCDVEILDVRPNLKEKMWLVNAEDASCSFISPKVSLPSFLTADKWSTTGITNFTYMSSVPKDEPSEELQAESAGFLSDYVTSVVT